MQAKYIKKEIADLNGMGSTQAYYRMETQPMSHEEFVSMCEHEGHMSEGVVNHVLELVASKLALSMAEGKSVKISGIGTFHAKLGLKDDVLQDAFEQGERFRTVLLDQLDLIDLQSRGNDDSFCENIDFCHKWTPFFPRILAQTLKLISPPYGDSEMRDSNPRYPVSRLFFQLN